MIQKKVVHFWLGFDLRSQDMVKQARRLRSYVNSGFPQVIEMGLLKLENAYKFPNLRCRGWACRQPSVQHGCEGSAFPRQGWSQPVSQKWQPNVGCPWEGNAEFVSQRIMNFRGGRAIGGSSCWGIWGPGATWFAGVNPADWLIQSRTLEFRVRLSYSGSSSEVMGEGTEAWALDSLVVRSLYWLGV